MNNNTITIGMSDAERYDILRDRTLDVPIIDIDKLALVNTDDYAALERIGKSGAFKLLRKIGEDFGIFEEDYATQDVEFIFRFSRATLHESVHRQQGQFQNYVKMLTIFDEVISRAVGIDMQGNRYDNPDSRLDSVFIFASGFMSDDNIVPVLLEVKTYTDNTTSSLYVAVSLSEIKRSRIVGYIPDTESVKPYPIPASTTISLANLLSNVNVSDKNLLKYVPDGFLDDAQKEAKQKALKETAEYIEKKNKQRAVKIGKTTDGSGFVGEKDIEYRVDGDAILFFITLQARTAQTTV